jgi:hypothetical protein
VLTARLGHTASVAQRPNKNVGDRPIEREPQQKRYGPPKKRDIGEVPALEHENWKAKCCKRREWQIHRPGDKGCKAIAM